MSEVSVGRSAPKSCKRRGPYPNASPT